MYIMMLEVDKVVVAAVVYNSGTYWLTDLNKNWNISDIWEIRNENKATD